MQYQGYVHPGFSAVASEFISQISDDGRSGAALAVYHQGQSVVDIWAGKRDHDGNPWLEDTLALSFSTTKGVASVMMHILVDRGLIEYDRPVSYYWPEFHGAGKHDITIRHLLCHQSGLYDIRGMIDDAMHMVDWERMIDTLEKATPSHRPGAAHGYHGLTYGWLLGEVMSRVTGKPFSELLFELLAGPLGLDGMYVGLPEDQMQRRALLANQAPESRERSGQPRRKRKASLVRQAQGQMINGAFRMVGLDPGDFAAGLAPRGIGRFSFNDPRVVKSCIPAANGMFTARSLARMYSAVAEGGELDGVRIMSPQRVRAMAQIQSRRVDKVVPIPMHWRLGFHRVFTTGPRTPDAFGHFGWGGSGAWCDPSRRLGAGFIVNGGGGTSPFGDTRIMRLNGAIIRCAERVEGKRGPLQNIITDRFYDLVN
ncbi:serine hydrolase domain-containing protein [Ketobacter alkanivorans]|uniref:Serine hydrolase n=1 Tax=Ketobacter alkanivorans TaxID=1917421 RepID=A0A2K9LQ81_9GAMM|nr:serine hydrolase domain-containing protein [Ketobacter alkanivorans]AUM14443.1 serine hydrolase [Ketobacter alkanivorans]MCP5014097.1 beta-lactamase family protein [Ketobacter sp.]